MAKEKYNLQEYKGVWYLDSYVSQNLINNKDLFINKLRPKYLDFIIISEQALWTESISTIAILLTSSLAFKLDRVVYASKCDSNLISLS